VLFQLRTLYLVKEQFVHRLNWQTNC